MPKRKQKTADPMFVSEKRKKELSRLIERALEIYPFKQAMRDVTLRLRKEREAAR